MQMSQNKNLRVQDRAKKKWFYKFSQAVKLRGVTQFSQNFL